MALKQKDFEYTHKEIALLMGLSVRTVVTIEREAMAKLEVLLSKSL